MVKPEEENNEDRQLLEEIRKELRQLSPWDLHHVHLYVKWVAFRWKLRKVALKWLIFQWELDENIKVE